MYTKMKHALVISLFALAGCSSTEADRERAGSPLTLSGQLRMNANKVVPSSETTYVHFAPGSIVADEASRAMLLSYAERSMSNVRVITPRSDPQLFDRTLAIVRKLRGMGLESTRIQTENSEYLEPDIYRLEITLLSVTPPNCPNWESSSVQTYSNEPFSQIGCSIVGNIGQQIKYPEDLERGRGVVRPDLERNSVVLQQYHSNAGASASTGDSGGSSEASSGSDSGSSSSAASGSAAQ